MSSQSSRVAEGRIRPTGDDRPALAAPDELDDSHVLPSQGRKTLAPFVDG